MHPLTLIDLLKEWLRDQHEKDGLVPSPYSVTLDKIRELEELL